MARSSSMTVERPGMGRYVIEYNMNTDELLIRYALGNKPAMALGFDQFLEAFERRIDDNRYRPISEEKRAKGEGR